MLLAGAAGCLTLLPLLVFPSAELPPAAAEHIQPLWWTWVLFVGLSHDKGVVFLAARKQCCVSGMLHPSLAVLHTHGPAFSMVPTAIVGAHVGSRYLVAAC